MEALLVFVLVYIEFIATILVAAVLVMAELAATVVSLLVEVTLAILFRSLERRARAAPGPAVERKPPPVARRKPAVAQRRLGAARRWARRVAWGFGGLLAVTLVAVFVLNTVFFEPTVRWLLGHGKSTTGVEITFESADGSLFSGRFVLDGATIQRPQNEYSTFDIRIDKLTLDLAVVDLMFGRCRFDEIGVVGAEGEYVRIAPRDRFEPRRHYEVSRFAAQNLRLQVVDRTAKAGPVTADLEVDSMKCEPFRTRWAVFDLLFRSDIKGHVEQQPLSISTESVEGANVTQWKAEGFPVTLVCPYLGKPFTWLGDGKVNIDALHRWTLEEGGTVKMYWRFVFRDFQARVPEGLSWKHRLAAEAAVRLLNRNRVELPLEFEMEIPSERFAEIASVEASGLKEAVADLAFEALAERTGINPTLLKVLGKSALDKVNGQ